MKSFWDDLRLKGHGFKFGEKLRIWWFACSLVVMGCVDDAPLWLLLLLTANFVASGVSMLWLSKKIRDDEKDEI